MQYNFGVYPVEKTMAEIYRKAIGSNVWHFCSNCNTWPVEDHIASIAPEQIGDEQLCNECVARHNVGDCKNYGDVRSTGLTKCPVIVHGRECGRRVIPDLIVGLHICLDGHRILVVPPAKTNNSI